MGKVAHSGVGEAGHDLPDGDNERHPEMVTSHPRAALRPLRG
jgi:hypothetical protein